MEDVKHMEEFEAIKSTTNKKIIGTHSDAFHCDEVLAVTLLLYTDEFSNSIIVRTRNEDILK